MFYTISKYVSHLFLIFDAAILYRLLGIVLHALVANDILSNHGVGVLLLVLLVRYVWSSYCIEYGMVQLVYEVNIFESDWSISSCFTFEQVVHFLPIMDILNMSTIHTSDLKRYKLRLLPKRHCMHHSNNYTHLSIK